MNRQSVNEQRYSRRWIFLLLGTLTAILLSGCSSTSKAEPGELSVRVFVDLDGSSTWNEGDVPLPEITVSVDGDQSGITGEEGLIRFEDVPQRSNTPLRSEARTSRRWQLIPSFARKRRRWFKLAIRQRLASVSSRRALWT